MEDQLFTVEQFCGMKVAEKRMWFVINELFKGEKHTLDQWIVLVSAQGIEVNK